MADGLLHVTFIIYRTTPLALLRGLNSKVQLEQNYSSGLVEKNMSLFAEISKYFYFV